MALDSNRYPARRNAVFKWCTDPRSCLSSCPFWTAESLWVMQWPQGETVHGSSSLFFHIFHDILIVLNNNFNMIKWKSWLPSILHSECCFGESPLGDRLWGFSMASPRWRVCRRSLPWPPKCCASLVILQIRCSTVLEGMGEWLNIKFLPRVYGILQ